MVRPCLGRRGRRRGSAVGQHVGGSSISHRPPSAGRCRGQIAIPAMFIFPTLFLFVFLIFETAKLSREKIRRQFAIDAAAFVEMTNYTDFLNRSAYVNGAFPMRIFREGFRETTIGTFGRTSPCPPGDTTLDNLLYDSGAFPRDLSNPDRVEFTTEPTWTIGYGGKRVDLNDESPNIQNPFHLIRMEQANCYNINWDDANQLYKLYVQIYQLLGSVESAQYAVVKRLTSGHNFLKKSYWLNTGGPDALVEAAGAVASFSRAANGAPDRLVQLGSGVTFHCLQTITFHGNQLVHAFGQPFQVWSPETPPTLPNTIGECAGLFQIVTVNGGLIRTMGDRGSGDYPGWPVEVVWNAPKNYFNVDLNGMMRNRDQGPRVHATAAARGWGATAAVWYERSYAGQSPGPTPKFQVRLYP